MNKGFKLWNLSKKLDNVYDKYLMSNEKEALQSISSAEEKLHHSLVKFGRFTIPTFFKPFLISPKQENLLRNASRALISILNKATDFYFKDASFRKAVGFSKEAEELMEIDPGAGQAISIARFDSFLEGEALKVLEMNTDSPAGMGYADLIEDIFCEEKIIGAFYEDHNVKKHSRSSLLLESVVNAFKAFGGSISSNPTIAIVDWRTVRTKPEFEALENLFAKRGYKTVIADPRELVFKNGLLYYNDTVIDIVYRRVIVRELLDKIDDVEDFLKAYKRKAFCMVNPLSSRIASSKAVLSVLTNPEYDDLFTDEENEAKREYLPWTRRTVDAEKFYGGRKIYMIDFLKDEKETLVLKPAEGYGGKDVRIGRETTEEEWNVAIDRALKGDWVVQEFINTPIITVPVVINNKLEFVKKRVNLNSFVFSGNYAGSFARLSDESVISVSHGGGLIPAASFEEAHQR